MKEFLSVIGLFSLFVLILYIMKKIKDHLYFKQADNTSFKLDKDEEDDEL